MLSSISLFPRTTPCLASSCSPSVRTCKISKLIGEGGKGGGESVGVEEFNWNAQRSKFKELSEEFFFHDEKDRF